MKVNLNFSVYPNIEEGDFFWRAPPAALKKVPYLYEHTISCLYMLFSMSRTIEQEGYTAEMHAAAHIRAALVEFVAIEEVMRNAGYNFRIISLRNPLLHFMRLLRNYQIHIGTHTISRKAVDIVFASQKSVIEVEVIDNLSLKDFMHLDAISKHRTYSSPEIENMIVLFNIQQSKLGVYQLLKLGVKDLIKEIEELI